MDFENKNALITGATRIGSVVANELARRGCNIILTYNSSKTKAEETATQVRSLGVQSSLVQANLTRSKEVAKVMTHVKKKYGHLDILVNMVSIYEKTPWV